jgi:hypothetical protein
MVRVRPPIERDTTGDSSADAKCTASLMNCASDGRPSEDYSTTASALVPIRYEAGANGIQIGTCARFVVVGGDRTTGGRLRLEVRPGFLEAVLGVGEKD